MDLLIPRPIQFKVEGNEGESVKTEIIDLDDYTSTEEKVHRLHQKVRNKIKSSFGEESVEILDGLMKWYIEVINEDTYEIEICNSLLRNMNKHLQFFYGYFKSLNWSSIDGYLNNMEDILALYLDLECGLFIKKSKKHSKRVFKKILKIYLMNQEDSIHHVLMKMKVNLSSDKTRTFLDDIFRTILSSLPSDTSDLAFCRAYILYQRWKKILKPAAHPLIDELLSKNYPQTLKDIETNPVLKQVLQPQNNSVLDVIAHVMDNDKVLCESYFKYIKAQKAQEDFKLLNIENERLPQQIQHTEVVIEDQNEPELQNNPETVSGDITIDDIDTPNTDDTMKKEQHDSNSDECIIIGEGTVNCNPEQTSIVHEIIDDDEDDILSIIYFIDKDSPSSAEKGNGGVSFLNSINDVDSTKGKNNSEIPNLQVSVTSPSYRLNLDNDSVKSREMLSRKATRKKDDVISADVISNNISDNNCISTNAKNNNWDTIKPTKNTEEPSHIFEGLVTPPTSYDDLHSYETDFHNHDLLEFDEMHLSEEEIFNDELNKETDIEDCPTHHSIVSSPDACSIPQSASKAEPTQQCSCPNLVDISSTSEPPRLPPANVQNITVFQNHLLQTNSSLNSEEETINELKSFQNHLLETNSLLNSEEETIGELSSSPEEYRQSITNLSITSETDTGSELNIPVEHIQNVAIDEDDLLELNVPLSSEEETVKTTDIVRKNGSIFEQVMDGSFRSAYTSTKESNAGLQKVDVTKKSTDKIIFTSKQSLKREMHSRYNALEDKHDLDDCLSGSIEKITVPTVEVDNYLFEDIISDKDTSTPLPSLHHDTNLQSSSDINSTKNNNFNRHLTNSTTVQDISKHLYFIEKASSSTVAEEQHNKLMNGKTNLISKKETSLGPPRKKKRITFSKKLHICPIAPNVESEDSVQDILSERICNDEIQEELLNKRRNSVRPNGKRFQPEMKVVLERENSVEMLLWKRFGESCKELLQVDYNKSTVGITSADKVYYRVPDKWWWNNSNNLELIDQGSKYTVAYNGRKPVTQKIQRTKKPGRQPGRKKIDDKIPGQQPERKKRGRPPKPKT